MALDPKSPSTFSQVLNEELKLIRQRRRVAEIVSPESNKPAGAGPPSAELPDPKHSAATLGLVGLALSAGGGRSASFNLGLLQALELSGFWKYVDYLSTVDGGGYVGAHVSSWVINQNVVSPHTPSPAKGWEAASPSPSTTDERPLLSSPTGKQSDHVRRLVRGQWLTEPTLGTMHYIFGLLIHTTIFLSFMVSFSAMVAFALRHFDDPRLAERLEVSTSGLLNSWRRPFIFPMIYCLLWFLVQATLVFGKRPSKPSRVSERFFKLGILLFVDGWAVVLSNQQLYENHAMPHVVGWVGLGLVLVLVLGLFPVLISRRIAAWAERPKNWLRDAPAVRLVATVLNVAIHLPLVFFFAQEDISDVLSIGGIDAIPATMESIYSRDQFARIVYAIGAICVSAILSYLVNPNYPSIFDCNRDRLERVYLEREGGGPTPMLRHLDTTAKGAPYHLLLATQFLSLSERRPGQDDRHPFVFSQMYCGSRFGGFCHTEDYAGGNLDLGYLMTLSGSSPGAAAGDYRALKTLLFVTNLELGQRLPNPANFPTAPRPTYWRLWSDRTRELPHYCYVAGGRGVDSLALCPLLERRCELILLADVTSDPDYDLLDFARLARRARLEDGIRFLTWESRQPIPLNPLGFDPATGRCARGFFAARILYPEGQEGLLLYLKASLTGDEEIDVAQYYKDNPAFPQEAADNLYQKGEQMESYRQLGFWVGQKLMEGFGDYARQQSALTTSELKVWLTRPAGPLAERPVAGVGDKIDRRVDDRLEALFHGPRLDNYDGYLVFRLTKEGGEELPRNGQVAALEVGEPFVLKVRLQTEEDKDGEQQRVQVSDGNSVSQVEFEVLIDSDFLDFEPPRRRVLARPGGASAWLLFNGAAAEQAGVYDVYIHLHQKNRVLQTLSLKLQISKASKDHGKSKL